MAMCTYIIVNIIIYLAVIKKGRKLEMSGEEFYKLGGVVTIPDEKKAEFNEYVLQMLDRGGIRKIKRTKLDGDEVELAARVEPDKKGIVRFDYSIFEKMIRDVSTYDMNTCRLEVNNCGFSEMGIVMAMILTLIEAYSITPCYMIRNGKMCDIEAFALILEDIMGIKLRFPHRADNWSMYLFSKECEEIKKLEEFEILDQVPQSFEKLDFNIIVNILYIDDEELLKEQLKEVSFDKDQIEQINSGERFRFLYTIYKNIIRAGEPLEDYIQKLINATLEERTAYGKEDSNFGMIAELSRYFTAQTLIIIYKAVKGTDFWSEWERFTQHGFYSDIIPNPYDREANNDHKAIQFYRAIQRSSDDESLGEFSDRNLSLSEDLEDAIIKWKKQAESVEPPKVFDSIEELKSLLIELKDNNGIRRMDYELFNELKKSHKNSNAFKAFYLLREIMYDGVELFPELTKEQAKSWIVERCRSTFDRQKINGLMGLLANRDKRMELLGF